MGELERDKVKSSFGTPKPADDSPRDEAVRFAEELKMELNEKASTQPYGGNVMCFGVRGIRRARAGFTRKGVKLDFKMINCVAPTLEYLRGVNAASRLQGHLWLNADVFAGPGALMSPVDAHGFVKLCAEAMPEAVLSLAWGSSILSTTRAYTQKDVEFMVELCMSPIIPRTLRKQRAALAPAAAQGPLPDGSPCTARYGDVSTPDEAGAVDVYLTPAAVCRHITFAVAAEYVLSSSEVLRDLLEQVPGSSLTVFCGVGSLGIAPATVCEIIQTFGEDRVFLDIKLSASAREDGCTAQ